MMDTHVASSRKLFAETGFSIASYAVITYILTSEEFLQILKGLKVVDSREDLFVLDRVMYFSLTMFAVFASVQLLRRKPLETTAAIAALSVAQPFAALLAMSSIPLGTFPPPSFLISLFLLPFTLVNELVQLGKGFVVQRLFSGFGLRFVMPYLIWPVIAVPASLFLAKRARLLFF